MATPSNMSGALPITTASMSDQVMPASSSASTAASRTRPGDRHVLARGAVRGLPDADDGNPVAGHLLSPSRTTTMFCCRHGPLVACATPRPASPAMMRRATSPMRIRPALITGFAASGPPDGLIAGVAVQPERLGEDQLLVAELRVQLGDVDRAAGAPAALAASARRLRLGEVAHAEAVRLDAVLDAADPRRPLAHRAGEIAGGDHDRDGAVGDRARCRRRAAGRASPACASSVVGGRRRPCAPRAGSPAALRCARAATSARSRSSRPLASRYARACSAAMSTIDGHSGAT